MNALELRLKETNAALFQALQETIQVVEPLLTKYDSNFPTYTDHSIFHTREVFNICAEMLTPAEIENLNSDEIYILSMSCFLHDIGMCIPEERIEQISNSEQFLEYKKINSELSTEKYIRDIHHELSEVFIIQEWEDLKIHSKKHADAIGMVSKGHRKVDLEDSRYYKPKFFVKNGREFVCLPYLAAILRLADELDVTNLRTPEILTKYYMPDNEVSIREWEKHKATVQRNFTEDYVLFEVTCTNHSLLAAIEEQFQKIKDVIKYSQKVIRGIANTERRQFSLSLLRVEKNIQYENFDPKGTKFSFDVNNVVKAFIGKDLYGTKYAALREAIQNAIDACKYRQAISEKDYEPRIQIYLNHESVVIEDNGLGMDDYIVNNFFSKLGSSFYNQDKVADQYKAIGQFGVGVFSYFLISDYIQIETKRSNAEPLKFLFDSDPKSYFHFFKDFKKEEIGTKLKMNLNTSSKEDSFVSEALDYIKKTFRLLDLQLEIYANEAKTLYPKIDRQYDFDINSLLQERISFKDHDKLNLIGSLSIDFDDEAFKGKVSILFPKKGMSFFVLQNMFKGYSSFPEIRVFSRYCEHSQFFISQQGVFVNDSFFNLRFCFGRINLRKKLSLSISRNDVNGLPELKEIYLKVSERLLKAVIEKIETDLQPNEEQLTTLTRSIINFFDYHPNEFRKEFNYELSIWIKLKTFELDVIKIVSLSELIESGRSFIIVSNKSNSQQLDKEGIDAVRIGLMDYKNPFNKVIAIAQQLGSYEPELLVLDDRSYMKYNVVENSKFEKVKEIIYQFLGGHPYRFEFCHYEGTEVIVCLKVKEESRYHVRNFINVNSEFIVQLIANFETVKGDDSLFRRVEAFFDIIGDSYITKSQERQKAIKACKEILDYNTTLNLSSLFSNKSIKLHTIREDRIDY